MKNILSFKVQSNSLTTSDTLSFYQLCKTSNCIIYLLRNGISCRVENIPNLMSFILTQREQDLLVVIEGRDAKSLKERLSTFFSRQEIQIG